MRLWLLACAFALCATTARADDEPAKRRNFDWGHMVGEGPSGYDKALARGDRQAIDAARFRRTSPGRLKRAIREYERAIALDPQRPEAYYRAAQTIYALYISDQRRLPSPLMTEKALGYWERFEKLAPLDPRIPDVLFQKSLALTKQATDSAFEQAVAIYDRLLNLSSPQAIDPNTISIYLGNKAELHMMLGQLDESIEDYYLALDYGTRSWLGYGLAVALDRDGQGTKARQIMRTNVLSDKNMSRLSSNGTFFVPAGEKNYYLALGYEVLGDYRRAVYHYRAFIDSGAHPRFHPRAREHIRRLEPKVKSSPRNRPRSPRPRLRLPPPY